MTATAIRKTAAEYNQGDYVGDTELKILYISAMNATGERIILAESPVEIPTYGDDAIEYDYCTLYMNRDGYHMYRRSFPGDDEGAMKSVKDFEARCTKHRVCMPLILG